MDTKANWHPHPAAARPPLLVWAAPALVPWSLLVAVIVTLLAGDPGAECVRGDRADASPSDKSCFAEWVALFPALAALYLPISLSAVPFLGHRLSARTVGSQIVLLILFLLLSPLHFFLIGFLSIKSFFLLDLWLHSVLPGYDGGVGDWLMASLFCAVVAATVLWSLHRAILGQAVGTGGPWYRVHVLGLLAGAIGLVASALIADWLPGPWALVAVAAGVTSAPLLHLCLVRRLVADRADDGRSPRLVLRHGRGTGVICLLLLVGLCLVIYDLFGPIATFLSFLSFMPLMAVLT